MAAMLNTRIDALVPWHPDFDAATPMYEPLRSLLAPLRGFADWPQLADLQALLDAQSEPIRTLHGAILKVVAQEGKPAHFGEHYVPRVHFEGELQTRTRNWHDLFGLLTWLLFPRAKAVLSAAHIPFAQQRLAQSAQHGRRAPMEDMLTQFDEGGVVILASDPSLLQLIGEFNWKQLFWQRRAELADKLHCVTFGHAIYEKGLAPYLGMTAKAMLLPVSPAYFLSPLSARLAFVDTALAALFAEGATYRTPRDLQPFPILGMPGWAADNAREGYYDNRDYFRPGRRSTAAQVGPRADG